MGQLALHIKLQLHRRNKGQHGAHCQQWLATEHLPMRHMAAHVVKQLLHTLLRGSCFAVPLTPCLPCTPWKHICLFPRAAAIWSSYSSCAVPAEGGCSTRCRHVLCAKEGSESFQHFQYRVASSNLLALHLCNCSKSGREDA